MCVCLCVRAREFSISTAVFPRLRLGVKKPRIHHIHAPRRRPAGSVGRSSAPAQSGPANAPAFPRPASRGRCEAMASSSP